MPSGVDASAFAEKPWNQKTRITPKRMGTATASLSGRTLPAPKHPSTAPFGKGTCSPGKKGTNKLPSSGWSSSKGLAIFAKGQGSQGPKTSLPRSCLTSSSFWLLHNGTACLHVSAPAACSTKVAGGRGKGGKPRLHGALLPRTQHFLAQGNGQPSRQLPQSTIQGFAALLRLQSHPTHSDYQL